MFHLFRRSALVIAVVSLFALLPTAHVDAAKTKTEAKLKIYKGNGVQFQVPEGWIIDDVQVPKAYNDLFTQIQAAQRVLVALVHPDYGQRALMLVVSDLETKKNGKIFDAKGYAVESMKQSGVIPNAKEMKSLTMAGLKAVQWKTSDQSDPMNPKESILTTVIHKDGVAYTLDLEAVYGLFKKDNKLRNAYMNIQKTFKFVKKGKSKK